MDLSPGIIKTQDQLLQAPKCIGKHVRQRAVASRVLPGLSSSRHSNIIFSSVISSLFPSKEPLNNLFVRGWAVSVGGCVWSVYSSKAVGSTQEFGRTNLFLVGATCFCVDDLSGKTAADVKVSACDRTQDQDYNHPK